MARLLSDMDIDEVSPVRRGANRRRWLLLKGEDVELSEEVQDMLAVATENEGATVDALRKAGADEEVQEATVAALRLLKAVEADLPEGARDEIEKLGQALYEQENEKLNQADDESPGEPENEPDADDVGKKDFSADERKALAAKNLALPDGSYPIRNKGDLDNAIQAFGRAKDKGRAKAWIIRRAKALGAASMLPESWGVSKEDLDAVDTDSPMEKENETEEGEVAEAQAAEAKSAVPVLVQKEDGTSEWDYSGVPAETRPTWEFFIKEREDLRSQVAKAREESSDLRHKQRERELVQKAEREFFRLGKPQEIGEILKQADDAEHDGHLPEGFGERLEGLLKSAHSRVDEGELFKELGRTGGFGDAGDAWERIEKLAEDLVEKSEDLSKAQAIDRVLKTEKGMELYSLYLAENPTPAGASPDALRA